MPSGAPTRRRAKTPARQRHRTHRPAHGAWKTPPRPLVQPGAVPGPPFRSEAPSGGAAGGPALHGWLLTFKIEDKSRGTTNIQARASQGTVKASRSRATTVKGRASGGSSGGGLALRKGGPGTALGCTRGRGAVFQAPRAMAVGPVPLSGGGFWLSVASTTRRASHRADGIKSGPLRSVGRAAVCEARLDTAHPARCAGIADATESQNPWWGTHHKHTREAGREPVRRAAAA